MKIMVIPPEQLSLAVEIATAAVSTGHGMALSPSDRNQLEMVLASACHGSAALEEFLAAIMEAQALGLHQANELPFEEIPTAEIIKEGFLSLSDEHLIRLATSPEAIRKLNALIEQALLADKLGDFWWKAYAVPDSVIPPGYLDDHALRRALDDVGLTPDAPKTTQATTNAVPRFDAKPRAWRTYSGSILAFAACLLVGVFLGWHIRGGGEGRHETLVASARVEPSLLRGPNDEKLQQVRVKGPFDGFITVLALAPDRKQRVFPEFGADDKPVASGATRTASRSQRTRRAFLLWSRKLRQESRFDGPSRERTHAVSRRTRKDFDASWRNC